MNPDFQSQDYTDKLLGKILGKYEIVDHLGYGGMAQVFKANHKILNRYVAVKILHPQFASDKEFVNMFIKEARSLANLRHPNIVQIHDIDIDDDLLYLVMEFINGESLKQKLIRMQQSNRVVPLQQCIRLIQYVGGALSYAHKQEMVHRDVKPSNVLLEQTGRVVLADFGLAKLESDVSNTLTGIIRGTPAYMSPEQGMGKSGESRSDIYSLGVMFYELSCGKLPFVAENPFAQILMHINEPPPPPSSIAREIPGNVEKVILKSIEKEPDDRYKTIDLMLKDISQLSAAKTGALPTARLPSGKDLDPGTLAPTVSENVQVSLHIIDTGQFLVLTRGQKYTLGRSKIPKSTSIDLSPFKGYEWGISRKHAELDLGDSIVLRDLESSNGTRYNGKKLAPFVPMEVNHGDKFMLGKLKIQVLVYED